MRRSGQAVHVTALLGALVGVGCSHPAGPRLQRGDVALVDAGETDALVRIDLNKGEVVQRSEAVPRTRDCVAFAPDSSVIFISGLRNGGVNDAALLALDARTLRVRWQYPTWRTPGADAAFPGVELRGNAAMAVSTDGLRLYVADAVERSSGAAGVAALDASSGRLLGLLSPFVAVALLPVPAAANSLPPNTIIGVGSRSARMGEEWLSGLGKKAYFISSRSLSVIDSMLLSEKGVLDPHLSQDGRSLFAASAAGDSLFRFDLLQRRRTAAVSLPRGFIAGPAAMFGQGGFLVSSGSTLESPGTGQVLVYNPELHLRASIQFPAATGGLPYVLGRPAVSPDGARLYVPAGTGRRGPVYGAQPPVIFVADLNTGKILQRIPVTGWRARVLQVEVRVP